MGLRSINNPTSSFKDPYSETKEYVAASGGGGGGGSPISATGGTKYTYGDYTIHKFTSSGSLVVASGSNTCNYIIVGGGGGTGCPNHPAGHSPGGGGAGCLHDNSVSIGPGTIPVTIGAGGAAET